MTVRTRKSATLEIDERVRARRAAGERVLHLGFGEAGLPVLPDVAEVLAGAVGRNGYGSVAGADVARAAVAGYFDRRGMPTAPEQVLLAPGSKALLFALLAALPGDVVLPQPSWVSYAAQAALAGKRVHHVAVPDSAGGVPDPQRLADLLDGRDGAEPAVLVLTVPDNPTGTRAGEDLLKQVLDVADRHGLPVVSDEIYRDLAERPGEQASPAVLAPERTVVTSGLSKSMALGGWRIGVARFPAGAWGDALSAEVVGIASEVWSSLAAPMQEAARYVFEEPAPVVRHVDRSRRLHTAVAQAVHAEVVGAGAACRPPVGPFYVYPDFASARETLAARGVTTGAQLADRLLEAEGVGVLAGVEFGDDPGALRFRAATSLLYGADDDQRWQALGSDDPTTLPWVADALAHLRFALRSVVGGR